MTCKRLKKWKVFLTALFTILIFNNTSALANIIDKNNSVLFYSTKYDKSELLQPYWIPIVKYDAQAEQTITASTASRFQEIDGFGYTLTGGSAELINEMSPNSRSKLLNELFSKEGIGVSYLRLSLGASDLSSNIFSYNDLPTGETDLTLSRFSIDEERRDLLPVLKQILSINPQIKIMASPWSPPTWMKSNNHSKGGSLKYEYYGVYALYLAKYIKTMALEGINIEAITIQNEPLHPGNNPSLYMSAGDQAKFIKGHLGPLFKREAIKTKIVIYDHNADRVDYPISILNDPDAKQYIDGSAFHLYGGEIGSLSLVHEAHPDKNIYFTEQWVGAPGNFAVDLNFHITNLIIGATRNWSKTVLEWNLAADPDSKPHTIGGCDRCLGAVTLDGDKVTRNSAYYIIAHASKHVRPGSYRIASNNIKQLPNVAFLNPDNEVISVVFNDSEESQTFRLVANGKAIKVTLDAQAVGTFVWPKIIELSR